MSVLCFLLLILRNENKLKKNQILTFYQKKILKQKLKNLKNMTGETINVTEDGGITKTIIHEGSGDLTPSTGQTVKGKE